MSGAKDYDSAIVPLKKPISRLNKLKRRYPIDIEFQDLTYSVRSSDFAGGWRQLLKSVNGCFRSGELTAILGTSGAGKSTLLNILAGYVKFNVKGHIRVNDRPREMKLFNKLSAYIMQDDILQPRLTVKESMMFAARLKLDAEFGECEREEVVDEVIDLLGLEKVHNVRSEHLSGGQRKRLAVALELVNNPPIIFLDEPTTGLDNVAIRHCMDLLHKISKKGRTVICTIHQPPASLFQTFDQVYVMADGRCVYNGAPSQLVPFLSMTNYVCPATHTPADFVLEIISQYPDSVGILSKSIENGKINMKDNKPPVFGSNFQPMSAYDIYQATTEPGLINTEMVYPQNVYRQTYILLTRMFLQISRNKLMLYIQFFHHIISGLLVGGCFFGIGNDATQSISLFKYTLVVCVFFMYTHVMSPVLLFPMEVKLFKREYFNRWYSLKAYYTAMTITTLPLMIIFGMIFLAEIYFLAGHPEGLMRFTKFCILGLALGFCSQGLGYSIGAACSILTGSVVGPSVLAPLLALAFYGMGYKAAIEPLMKFLMKLTYLRFGVVGFCGTLFDDRPPLDCPESELYCHFDRPEKLMIEMGMIGHTYTTDLLAIMAYAILFRICSYVILKYRMRAELSNQLTYYITKFIKNGGH